MNFIPRPIAAIFGGWIGYAAVGAVSAGLVGYGAYQVTAWAKDEKIKDLKLADAKAQKLALETALKRRDAQDAIVAAADRRNAYQQGRLDGLAARIPQEVSRRVPPKADADCILNNGSIKLLDAAGLGIAAAELPGEAGEPDGANSGIRLSEAVALLSARLYATQKLSDRLRNASDVWDTQAALK